MNGLHKGGWEQMGENLLPRDSEVRLIHSNGYPMIHLQKNLVFVDNFGFTLPFMKPHEWASCSSKTLTSHSHARRA